MNCALCRFCVKAGALKLECHKSAPQLDAKGVGAWPGIAADSWCGDYQPRTEPM
jgi:hypothetical protein